MYYIKLYIRVIQYTTLFRLHNIIYLKLSPPFLTEAALKDLKMNQVSLYEWDNRLYPKTCYYYVGIRRISMSAFMKSAYDKNLLIKII